MLLYNSILRTKQCMLDFLMRAQPQVISVEYYPIHPGSEENYTCRAFVGVICTCTYDTLLVICTLYTDWWIPCCTWCGSNHSIFKSFGLVGPLHEYSENTTSETLRQSCGSYSDYFKSLTISRQLGQPGRLVWRPDDNTPDTVYYQVKCTRHWVNTHTNVSW